MKKTTKNLLNVKKDLVNPFDLGLPRINQLISFYLYEAPGIDCIHSKSKIKNEKKAINELIKIAGFEKNFNFVKSITNTTFEKFELNGDLLELTYPRLRCHRKEGESEVVVLLRHIRNAFAHGRIYMKNINKKTYIMIEDVEKKRNRTNKITARMIIEKKTLTLWKEYLQKNMKKN